MADALEVAKKVEFEGLKVISSWHSLGYDSTVYEAPAHDMTKEAVRDLEELAAADAVLYLNLAKSEGKAVELGYALATSKPVYVVGGRQNNVFLHLPWGITHLDTVEEAIERICDQG